MRLAPPVLPPFLAGVFDLKPVEGVPNDEEVKMVHAVIRALNDVANVSALYDADLAMRLSMHLFSIQMVRYRDIYPCIIFPSNTTHTPPQLPAHIPIKLEPVTGSPSDEQIKLVQTSLRLYESMASIPSMFDADLNMKLSQHLFNIQFERYLHQVADEDRSTPVATSGAKEMHPDHSGSIESGAGDIGERNSKCRSRTLHETSASCSAHQPIEESPDRFAPESSTAAQLTVEQLEHVRSETQPPTDSMKVGREETNQLLVKICSTLENVNQVLIGTQQNMARALNTTSYDGYSGRQYRHTLVNAKGESPHYLGYPSLARFQRSLYRGEQVQDSDIVRYLRFYDVGVEFIEEGDEPRIKEDKREAAKAELTSYFGS